MTSLTPHDFVSKWKRAEARERQSVQEHFIDLCRLVGDETPMQADPTGKKYAFEMGAAKTSGGSGWADVAKLGYFGWEYKGKHADLDKAYDQLLRYRDALNNPPLLIVSDIDNIVIRTNYTNLPTRTITLTLDDLLNPESSDFLFILNEIDLSDGSAKLFGYRRKSGIIQPNQDRLTSLVRVIFCQRITPRRFDPYRSRSGKEKRKDRANRSDDGSSLDEKWFS